MKKLLHERLRDIGQGNYTHSVELDSGIIMLNPSEAAKLANEIEKYYQPLPRDPEGNPVHKDMEVEGGVVKHWSVSEDGSWTIFDDDYEEIQCGDKNEPIRLPEPKVLDAEGVEIKVGDTVWGKYSGVEHEVIGFDSCDGLLCVSIRNVETCSTGGSSPNLLTHREPDSLEKLLVDLRGAADFIPSKEYLKHLADRLTAIMERDA